MTITPSSNHILDVRDYDYSAYAQTGRKLISYDTLLDLIRHEATLPSRQSSEISDDENAIEIMPPSGSNLKRAHGGNAKTRSRKRAKLAQPAEDEEDPAMDDAAATPHKENFLAFSHVFEIQCTSGGHIHMPVWPDQEVQFLDALTNRLGHADEPDILTINEPISLRLQKTKNRVHAFRKDRQHTFNNTLFVVPQLVQDDFDLSEHEIKDQKHSDVLVAVMELCAEGRAQVDAKLRIQFSPDSESPNAQPEDLPYTFLLEVTVSLLAPSIFLPIGDGIGSSVSEAQRRLIYFLFDNHIPFPSPHKMDIPRFYASLRPAPPSQQLMEDPQGLTCKLLPFQQNSVRWMLGREGKTLNDDGEIVDKAEDDDNQTPVFWTRVPAFSRSKGGKEAESFWWVNSLTGEIRESRPTDEDIVGGLLAEEPGLGKTVESIALVLYNTPSSAALGPSFWSNRTEVNVTPIKGTLIVTPSTLFKQWAEEIARHAPGLRVLQYEGWTSASIKKIISRSTNPGTYERALGIYPGDGFDDEEEPPKPKRKQSRKKGKGKAAAQDDEEEEEELDDGNMDWLTFVGKHDVVLCTYNTLMSDLAVARPPVKRPRREVATYQQVQEKFRSPLVLVEWQRVLMDEVQQVGNGQAAEMVSLIPRRSSFAVSGTPAKATIKDLIAPLRFLQLDIGPKTWTRLLEPAFYDSFVGIFDQYAIRTSKAEAEGLNIPKQTRYVVPISLGMIERHFYEQTLETALLELGVDNRGVAMYNEWALDTAMLRSAIRRLRMACIHPQVGNLGGQAAGPLGGAIRPIGDVLANMVEVNWQAWMTERRNMISAKVQHALLIQRGRLSSRHKNALDELLAVRTEINTLLTDLKDALAQHDLKGKALIKDANDRDDDGMIGETDDEDVVRPSKKGKGKEKEKESDEDDLSPNPELLPASAEGDEHRRGRMAFLSRIREVQVVLHRVEFSLGDIYHHFGKGKEEDESYAQAEALRRSLLKTTEKAAEKSITKLKDDIRANDTTIEDLIIDRARRPGIKSEVLFDEANEIIAVLDEQSHLLFKWRDHIYGLLTQKIVSDGENDGQEYQRALDTQVEVECYLKAYSALLADRREVLNEERTALAAHAEHERKLRHTKAAARAAAAFDERNMLSIAAGLEAEEVEDPELTKELKGLRKDCRDAHGSKRALKSVMIDLTKVAGSDKEAAIAKAESLRLRRVIQNQTALVERLSNEQAPFRTTFNGRIAYFRQLQEISDSVAEIDLKDLSLEEALADNEDQTAKLSDSVRTTAARQRYLQYIAKKADNMDEEDKECGICNCDFETGFLLACGHIFCDECLEAWRKKGHKACSTCREQIDDISIHAIKFSRSAEDQIEELKQDEANEINRIASLKTIRYKTISAETLQELSKVESFGQQGAKIQTLIRHLLLIEQTDPGSKSIVFSAWADSLDIIEHGLRENGISSVQISKSRGKDTAAYRFQKDPTIRTLLLHGERDNAGLNLTCAKRIMLVEPTVNSSFEIQAIARVDRLGQQEQTEVYCYYATDTVEQNILDNAARKGTSLYTLGNADTAVNLAAPSVLEKQEVEAGKNKAALKGDFIAGSRQMLEVLFPSLFVEIEDIEMEDVIPQHVQHHSSSVAGPSWA